MAMTTNWKFESVQICGLHHRGHPMSPLVNHQVLLSLPPYQGSCLIPSTIVPDLPSYLNTEAASLWSPHHTACQKELSPSLSLQANLNRCLLCFKAFCSGLTMGLPHTDLCLSCEVGHRPCVTDNKAPKTPMTCLFSPVSRMPYPRSSVTGSAAWQTGSCMSQLRCSLLCESIFLTSPASSRSCPKALLHFI